MTHFEWPVGSPTRGQICWRKSDNMLSDLKIVESIVKSKSDNMLSDFHGNPTVCCRIWGAHSKWVGAREGRPPSQGASPLSSLKPLTKNHETQFYSKWVNSKWVRVSPRDACHHFLNVSNSPHCQLLSSSLRQEASKDHLNALRR